MNRLAYLSIITFLSIGMSLEAQNSPYDPPLTQTFSQAVSGWKTLNYHSFGTNAGKTIQNVQQLGQLFNPYGIAGTTVIDQEWQRYQPFNNTNFVFTPNTLNLTATIPSGGGLFPAGINSGQIWSKQTYQPGKNGVNAIGVCILMQFPSGAGMFPALWMFSPVSGDSSEIDIVEFMMMEWQNQYDWVGVNHGPGAGSDIYSLNTNPWVWQPGIDFSAAPHWYSVIWTPDATYKYFDDKLIRASYYTWTSNQQAQLGVNLAVGSNNSGAPGLMPNSLSEFPSALQLQSIWIVAR
jgi:beta-glucanase (GH16 family)